MTAHSATLPIDFTALRRTQLLVERVADYAIYMLTPEGNVASWNAGGRRFKGYSDQEIIGRHFSCFYTPEDQARGVPSQALETALREGKFEGEGWRVRKDGTRFWASVLIDAIRDDNGELVGFAKITRDISERKAAQDALRASEERFRLLVQGVIDYAIYMLSPTGIITNWNSGAQRIKGYSADEVIGTHFSRFYTDADRASGLPEHGLNTARTEGRFEAEGWRVRKDGTRFRASVVIDAIRNDAGELIGFAKVTRDVTQRVLLEETQAALQHAQRLESIGKLTGGVAHDFNNILQVIGGNLQLLLGHMQNNNPGLRYVEASLGAVERGAKLSSQLLAFARRQPLQPLVVNTGRVVRGMEELLRRALGETIDVETVVSGSLWNTQLDPNQLENVVLNLAINARDAMPNGGKLTIELGNSTLDDDYVRLAPDVPAGQYVLLAISDTGTGMSKEVLERAVEPFFTTKPEGRGTGLGLSMAFGFVKQSNGHFRIYSEPGEGTTIKMYFPRVYQAEDAAPASAPTEARGGSETILVVEDDVSVQNTVVEMLSSLGYKVLKADNAESALAVLKAGVHCDLLFTDVVMPGSIKTPELARQAKSLVPGLEVLYTSGYTQNAIVHGGRLDPGVQLLSKPYRREDLAAKINQLLRGKRVEPAAVAPQRNGLRILVVEDDNDARSLLCELLCSMGHDAQGVRSAEDAIRLLTTRTVDVLLTDYLLPGIDGVTLCKQAKRMQPRLKVVIASGFSDFDGLSPELNASLLRKPYKMEDLNDLLKQALASKERS
jgi:PAS domain S-box-containing protein